MERDQQDQLSKTIFLAIGQYYIGYTLQPSECRTAQKDK